MSNLVGCWEKKELIQLENFTQYQNVKSILVFAIIDSLDFIMDKLFKYIFQFTESLLSFISFAISTVIFNYDYTFTLNIFYFHLLCFWIIKLLSHVL